MKRFNKVLIILAILAIVFVYADMAKAKIVEEGLVSYWPLDEADVDGDTVRDFVGPNDGTIIGDLKSVPGMVGEALEFDGVATMINMGMDPSLDMGSAVTMEAWVKWRGGYAAVLGRDYSYVSYIKDSGTTRIATQTTAYKWGGQPVVPNYNIKNNAWTHVVSVYEDGEGAKLYIDGVYIGARDPAPEGDIVNTANNFYIGGGCMNKGFFNGVIDEVRLYNVALNLEEIKQNFESRIIRGFAVESLDKLVETWGKIKASK